MSPRPQQFQFDELYQPLPKQAIRRLPADFRIVAQEINDLSSLPLPAGQQ
jgi:hypothetical protein